MNLTVANAFEVFANRLEITTQERSSAIALRDMSARLIAAKMPVDKAFISGSFARGTKAKPLEGVDVFVILSDSQRGRLEHPPTETLIAAYEAILPRYGAIHVAQAPRSIFVDSGLHSQDEQTKGVESIEVFPAFAAPQGLLIPDTKLGEWINVDLAAHDRLAKIADEKLDGHWKLGVQMIKKWNSHNGNPIEPSFLLEVMALKLLVPPLTGRVALDLKKFFGAALARVNKDWPDPGGVGPMVSERLRSDEMAVFGAMRALRKAETSFTEALGNEREGRVEVALAKWRSIFGPLFPTTAGEAGIVEEEAKPAPFRQTGTGVPRPWGPRPTPKGPGSEPPRDREGQLRSQ